MFPEVVFLAEAENLFSRNADLLVPDVERLVVIQIDGRIQAVLIKADDLRQEFPGPGNGFVLEIIPEGKVAEHLEEGQMTGGMADIFNITGTHALLAGCHTVVRRHFLAGKIRLKRCHTCRDQQYALIVMGNKGIASPGKMSLGRKEIKEHFAKLVYAVIFLHNRFSFLNSGRKKAPCRIRTGDLRITNASLYQLSQGSLSLATDI